VSSSTLAARLADLEEAGLIARAVYPDTPPRVEYSLTPRGREVCGILTDFLRRDRRFEDSFDVLEPEPKALLPIGEALGMRIAAKRRYGAQELSHRTWHGIVNTVNVV